MRVSQHSCKIAQRAMVAAAAQLLLWNGKFLSNVKRNPFSGLEKEKKVICQCTRWQTNQADTTEFTSFFPLDSLVETRAEDAKCSTLIFVLQRAKPQAFGRSFYCCNTIHLAPLGRHRWQIKRVLLFLKRMRLTVTIISACSYNGWLWNSCSTCMHGLIFK